MLTVLLLFLILWVFSENEKCGVRYLRDFEEDHDLARDFDVFVVIKSFKQIEKNFRAFLRKKEKVFGRTRNRDYDYGCIFAASLDSDMLSLSDAFWRYCTKEPSCIDIHEERGTMLITGGDRLIEFDIFGDKEMRVLYNDWFRQLHTGRYSKDGKRILVSSTGFDQILEIDTESSELTWEFDPWSHGYGFSRREDHFTRSEEVAHRLEELGASFYFVKDPLEWPGIGIPTGLRPCHTNGAFYNGEELIGVTMAHKSVAIFVNRTSKKIQNIPLENTRMVHALDINDNDVPCRGYILADTKGGSVVFIDEELNECDRISLEGMEGETEGREEVGEWLQYVTRLEGDLYNIVDVHRSMIHIFDVREGTKRSLRYPIEYAVQEVVLMNKSTSETLKKLPFFFLVA